MKNKKHTVGIIVLVVYVVATLGYVAWNEYNRLGVMLVERARAAGAEEAVNGVIQLGSKCETFTVNNGANEVQLINVECLQQAQPAEMAAPVEIEE